MLSELVARSLVDGPGQFSLGIRDLIRRKATAPAPRQGEENPVVTKLVSHPLIAGNADKAAMPANAGNVKLPNAQRRKLPSYVASRSFARALIDLTIPDSTGRTTS